MNALLLSCLIAPLVASPLDQGVATEMRYNGSLIKLSRDADGQAVKNFSLYFVMTKQQDGTRQFGYLVNERGGGAWPWPERFGLISLNAENRAANSAQPRLLYDHEGSLNPIRLPYPLLSHSVPLLPGATWKSDNESFEVKQASQAQNRECWQIDVATNFGRKRSLWVEKETAIVVRVEERIFMGQGVEFTLKMQLESLQALDEPALAKTMKPFEQLLKLQSDLKRAENEQKPELSEAQLAIARSAITDIEKAADGTPFGHIAGVAGRDIKLQLQRSDEVFQLAKKLVGQAAPPFVLELLDDNQSVSPKDREGKITLLHFWEYQGEPLAEPYGQVGYLDYLFSRRRKLGVQVYGVAVDAQLGEKDKKQSIVRSVNKLKSFMNLGYPIALDNGDLLGKFGDPRKLGAKLPLWVVIDAEGKIVHYNSGFYKINPDEGLRLLDEVVVKLIQQQREKEIQSDAVKN